MSARRVYRDSHNNHTQTMFLHSEAGMVAGVVVGFLSIHLRRGLGRGCPQNCVSVMPALAAKLARWVILHRSLSPCLHNNCA